MNMRLRFVLTPSFNYKETKPIDLAIESDRNITLLKTAHLIILDTEQKNKHWGIYGAIKKQENIKVNEKITVCTPTSEDVNRISSLPNKKWAFFLKEFNF